ncbi:MAG: hypothetical protein ACRDKB_14955 [Actinomycetota bacterium]
MRIDGHEKVEFGPLSFCQRDFPHSSTLIVKKAKGESPTSFDFDHEFSDQHKERHIYRYTNDGVLLDFEGAEVTCGGVAQTSETEFSPPQNKVQLPLRVGARWSGEGGDEGRTEHYQAKVLRKEKLTVAGRTTQTFVIEIAIDMTGSERGRRFQRWWYSPNLALPVRWYEEIEAERSGATYQMEAMFTVVSLP